MTSKPKITKEQARDTMLRSNNDKIKKHFSQVTDKTKRLDVKPLPEIISGLLKISIPSAKEMIKNYDVTVNGDLVTDPNYVLKSGDIVRTDVGHYLNNSGFMAVIK